MSFPRNEALRAEIATRVQELQSVWTVGEPSPAHQVAEERGISYQMVCYYLRGSRNQGGRDMRRSYTIKELHNLETMTPQERKEFAERSGRSLRAVDAALTRYRKAEEEYLKEPHAEAMATDDVVSQGFFNWASLVQLKVNGLTPDKVRHVRQILADSYHLSLRAPNILYHRPSGRRYYMNAAEQRALLHSPKIFLRDNADTIKTGWVASQCDPIGDENFKYTEPSDYVQRRVSKSAKAALAASVKTQAERMTRTLEQVRAGNVLARGTATFNILVKLGRDIDMLIGEARPEFSPSDPGTFTDLTTPKRSQSAPARQEKVSEDKSIFEDATTDEELLKILDDSTNSPTDEDAWMKDFKPASAQYEEVDE